MPEIQRRTLDQVLADLEHGGTGPWVVLEGYFAITSVEVILGSVNFNPGKGVPMKAFLNTRTGEIRTFAAKFLDVPDAMTFGR
ncbi:MAG: hypothetical protein HY078_10410 [Elusimicrobia bacterium]|nr:hypothetical protein [Elusimicrobiota bacterium]